MKNIVLNIPHSSINGVFDKNFGGWQCNPYFMDDCLKKWTDWYTDMLFNPLSRKENVETIVFPYSRFVCDVERLKNDPLENIGQGIIYTEFDGYKRNLTEEQKKNIMKLWEKHQTNLQSAIKDENTVLIDCHSFPSNLASNDICIGYNDDWSYNKEIIDGIIKIFEKEGYSVEKNIPYSNSITPEKDFPYNSVMIEVNKRIYMNENLMILEKNARQWMRWSGTLEKIYNFLQNV